MTTYYDTIFNGLIPCKLDSVSPDGSLNLRITKAVKAYKKGDIVNTFPRYFVEKAGVSGFRIMVRPAQIK